MPLSAEELELEYEAIEEILKSYPKDELSKNGNNSFKIGFAKDLEKYFVRRSKSLDDSRIQEILEVLTDRYPQYTEFLSGAKVKAIGSFEGALSKAAPAKAKPADASTRPAVSAPVAKPAPSTEKPSGKVTAVAATVAPSAAPRSAPAEAKSAVIATQAGATDPKAKKAQEENIGITFPQALGPRGGAKNNSRSTTTARTESSANEANRARPA